MPPSTHRSSRRRSGSPFGPRAAAHDRFGFTLVELLAVTAIVSIVVSLAAPALGSAREAARRTACQNNLRQLAVAAHSFEDLYRALPSAEVADGWATWAVSLLPQIEQSATFEQWEHGTPYYFQPVVTEVATPVFVCPTQVADASPRVSSRFFWPGGRASGPACRLDYAGVRSTTWWPENGAIRGSDFSTPLSGLGSRIIDPRLAGDVSLAGINLKGTSTTALFGEKIEPIRQLAGSGANGDAWRNATRLLGENFPPSKRGSGFVALLSFGSDHPDGVPLAFADGSCRMIEWGVDRRLLGRFGRAE